MGRTERLLRGIVLVQGNMQEDGREGTDWKRSTFSGRMVQHVCVSTIIISIVSSDASLRLQKSLRELHQTAPLNVT